MKKVIIWLAGIVVVAGLFILIANLIVIFNARGHVFTDVKNIPHHRVGMVLGANPMNRRGGVNIYFRNRMRTAAELYNAGKVDYLLVSGDNSTRTYDEPTAMRDSLISLGVPSDRIVLDYAGFRTLDSVVRAKKIFGCDELTIVSQDDHCERALYLCRANGIEADAFAAPIKARGLTKIRMTIREILARPKMILDIIFGKSPRYLGKEEPI